MHIYWKRQLTARLSSQPNFHLSLDIPHYGKLSDLIIEFQLATNPAELFPGWKLESQEEEMIDYAFKMRGFSLRIFSRPLCSSTDVALWFMEFRSRRLDSWTFRFSITVFLLYNFSCQEFVIRKLLMLQKCKENELNMLQNVS